MSDIVLSASVRQNLLSLQSTADLLATTQTRLATGKKVNTALDNPTNFFTAAGLDARASDINNLLDGIGNGVQVLQAANTGITSLQKLIDSAKSIANQALQTQVGYTKSVLTTLPNPGANGANILGGGAYTNNTVPGNGVTTAGATTYASVDTSTDAVAIVGATTAPVAAKATGTADLSTSLGTVATGQGITITIGGVTKTIGFHASPVGADDGFVDTTTGTPTGADLVSAINNAFNAAFGGTAVASLDGATNALVLTAANATDTISVVDKAATTGAVAALGASLASAAPTSTPTAATIGGATLLSGTSAAATGALTTAIADGDSFSVNGKTITFSTAATSTNANGGNINVGGTLADVVSAINAVVGTGAASIAGGKLSIQSGTVGPLTITAGGAGADAAAKLGLTGLVTNGAYSNPTVGTGTAIATGTLLSDLSSAISATDTLTVNNATIHFYGTGTPPADTATDKYVNLATATVGSLLTTIDGITGASPASAVNATNGVITLSTGTASDLTIGGTAATKLGLASTTTPRTTVGGLSGLTLSITPINGSATATNITFGTAVGQVYTINQLNAALLSNNLQASIDTTGAITITTANDAASSTIGTLSGTATNTGNLFAGLSGSAPSLEPNSQATRAGLVSQYNNIINQIRTTSQDASFNGVNLLNGDQLKLIFNETGKSTLNITGINLDPAGLGLGALTPGTDFVDNVATNKVLDSLNYASSFLRSQASTLGSNLSIVQIRQDFSKNLINVLQTGSSNLTIADTNEEAANSQALSTRQSIAVSALALANQSQQSVLQLLRT